MFLGAGSAATGIADLMTTAFQQRGLGPDEARRHLWFVDVNGLVVKSRTDLLDHNLPYAHDAEPQGFLDAIDTVRPHVLIGATGAPGTFTREVVERMSAINDRPVIFALSNPTSKAECTAEQAYAWSRGKAIFASGSPFGPVTCDGKMFRPAQGNNAYVFPGIGLGAVACHARTLPDELFLEAARVLRRSSSGRIWIWVRSIPLWIRSGGSHSRSPLVSLRRPMRWVSHGQEATEHSAPHRRDDVPAVGRLETAAMPTSNPETPGRNALWFLLSLGFALGLTVLVREPHFNDSQIYVLFLLVSGDGAMDYRSHPALCRRIARHCVLGVCIGESRFNSEPQDIAKYANTFSSSVIWLMLGGFFLAEAMTKDAPGCRLVRVYAEGLGN
jgi:hypothetical protein